MCVRLLNRVLRPLDAEVVRYRSGHPHIRRYVNAKQIQAAAKRESLDVLEYVERISPNPDVPGDVVNRLASAGILDHASSVVEIGTGCGRFAHQVLLHKRPQRYESYEPDEGWSSWLSTNLGVTSQPSDGFSLAATASGSIDLVMAHGVFLYLPFLTALRYFDEIVRVTHEGSFVVFDIYSFECFDDPSVKIWLESGETWPVALPKDFVVQWFSGRGFALHDDFFSGAPLKTHYLVFQRRRGDA
jgi:hypothetical protein